jgi:FkbM family methyltransferase
MSRTARPAAFILTASDHGTMIVNRFDYGMVDGNAAFGVGFQVLQTGGYDQPEVEMLLHFLHQRRQHFGDGVVALDCGANIGVHTVEWAKRMTGWGSVLAIEAQERVFYALAGNICINNCLNARAIHAALSAEPGTLRIPVPDYLAPANFGGLELRASQSNEFIGQAIDYSETATTEIKSITIDGLALPRVDLMKIDVEGMEAEVLDGARETIAAFLPVIVAEHTKVGWKALEMRLSPLGYKILSSPMNMVAVHQDDPTSNSVVQA